MDHTLHSNNFRAPVRNFTGRTREIEEVMNSLNGRGYIVSLLGPGGIGKTELALKIADECSNNGLFDKVLWTTAKNSWLTPSGIKNVTSSLTFDDILNEIIKQFTSKDDHVFYTLEEKKSIAVRNLSKEKCLLIVDNLETVDDVRVIKFIQECPHPSKILITSRHGKKTGSSIAAQQLQNQEEVIISSLKTNESVELFKRLVVEEHLILSEKESNDEFIAEVVDRLGNMPLAVEWIVKSMIYNDLSVSQALKKIRSVDSDVLKFCFSNLIEGLNSGALDVLNSMSIFKNSASVEAVAYVSELPEEDVLISVRELASFSLVEYHENNTFNIIEPARIYVEAEWEHDFEQKRELFINGLEYYLAYITNSEKIENWEVISKEHVNILYIFSWFFAHRENKYVLQMAKKMSNYLNRIGLWDDRILVCDAAIVCSKLIGDKNTLVKFQYDIAHIYKQRGNFDDALARFNETARISFEEHFLEFAYLSKMQTAIIYARTGDLLSSNELLEEALVYFNKINDSKEIARVTNLLGRNLLSLGSIDLALEKFLDSLNVRENLSERKDSISNKLGIAIGNYDLGYCYLLKGDYYNSRQHLEASKLILEQIGEMRHYSNLLWYFANLEIKQSRFNEAKYYLNRVLTIEKKLDRTFHQSRAEQLLKSLSPLVLIDEVKLNNDPGKIDIDSTFNKSKPVTTQNIQDKQKRIKKIFISYSREDVQWLYLIKKYLTTIQNAEFLLWDDSSISPGAKWREELDDALNTADIALLLISINFFNSTFIKDHELPTILKNNRKSGLKVIQLLVHHTPFEESNLSEFKAFNDNEKALSLLSSTEQEKLLVEFTRFIRDYLLN